MSVNPLFVAPQESVGFYNDDVTFSQGVEWYVLLSNIYSITNSRIQFIAGSLESAY